MNYGKLLDKYVVNVDPLCKCGDRKHEHSDDGPCYKCPNCDFFEEKDDAGVQ